MLSEANAAAQTTKNEVIAALRQASAQTGSDFSYLLGTAMRESGLKPNAKAESSSAAGLFQFVQQTWLGMIKQYGAKFGLNSYANAIHKSGEGHYTVDDQADREAILGLRNDPKVAALMAGEYAQQTRNALEARLGRDVSGGELYVAHFLGAGAGCRLIELAQNSPHANAAQCFPAAADANPSVFYNHDGTAKSVREVYNWAVHEPAAAVRAERAGVAAVTSSKVPTQPSSGMTQAMASFFAQNQASEDISTLGLFRDGHAQSEAPLLGSPVPQPPFTLTADVMNVLSALDPAAAMPGTGKPKAG